MDSEEEEEAEEQTSPPAVNANKNNASEQKDTDSSEGEGSERLNLTVKTGLVTTYTQGDAALYTVHTQYVFPRERPPGSM